MKIIRLRTENREHPYGIDVKNPVFSLEYFCGRAKLEAEKLQDLRRERRKVCMGQW